MIRRAVLWLLTGAFVWLVLSRADELRTLTDTLLQGRWQWVLVAVLLQVGYYGCYALIYKAAFATVKVRNNYWNLLFINFAAVFINTTAPSGGAAGLALFVDDAGHRGESRTRTAVGTMLVLVANYGAFSLVLLVGLVSLFLSHDLRIYEIAAALVLFSMVAFSATMLTLGIWRPLWLHTLLDRMQRVVNHVGGWFMHPDLLAEGWSERNAAEFTFASKAMVSDPLGLVKTLAASLAAQLFAIATLYSLFLAFNRTPTLGLVVAGYSMTMLFWIVSPTPSGIGVVEALMPVIYASLGLPVAEATLITLAFRGMSFWLPLLIGFVALRQLRSFNTTQRAAMQVGQVHIIAILTGLMGVVNILSGATPSLASRVAILDQFSPLAVRHGGHLTAVLSGFALIALAQALWRRKQTAWLLTVAVLALSIISHLVKGLDYEETSLAALLMVLMFTQRRHFHALSDLPSIWQGVRGVVFALVGTLVYGTVGFFLLDQHFGVSFSLETAMRQTLFMFGAFYDPGLEPTTGFGRYFAGSIYVVGGVTGIYALWMLMRPVLLRTPPGRREQRRAQEIVEAHGRSALARFVLFPDKSYFFSRGGSVIAYGVRGRTAITLGDPIGPAQDMAQAIAEFMDFCGSNDWEPSFFQVLPDHLDAYRAAGFSVLCLGHEGIVDTATFSLAGGSNKSMRAAINKLRKSGFQATVHQPPLSDDLLNELRDISDQWLTMMHGSEKRFSLGWFEDEYVRSGPVVAVHGPDGGILAFANLVPEYQRNERAIDLMRRRQHIENGTMDFLFASLFEWAKDQGIDTINLGMSPLSGVGEAPDDPALERAMHFVYENINQFYSFKGLHEFKQKFHPDWSPRYLIYPSTADLPNILLVLTRISSGDSFLMDTTKDLAQKAMAKRQAK